VHQRKEENGQPLEQGPEEILAKRCGLVVADASNLFEQSFKRDDLIECGCNAHGRRGFVKALDRGDSRAAITIGAYRRLYEVEREARDVSIEERTALRQRKSRPVFDAILKWCQAYERFEPPSSPLGAAIRYFNNHHVALGRFIDDGTIPIDNSLVERQHVRVALTRKNFLFVGSDACGGDVHVARLPRAQPDRSRRVPGRRPASSARRPDDRGSSRAAPASLENHPRLGLSAR
jgi:hypothetical protein